MGKPSEEQQQKYIVPGLRRGLELLELMGGGDSVMSLTDLSRKMSLSSSTVYRLIRTLEGMGYLQSVPGTKSYRLGPRILKLGFQYLNSEGIIQVARADLETLRDETGASTHLGVLDGREVVYICRVPSRGVMTSNIQVGSRLPAHATAMGRVLLSGLSSSEFSEVYDSRSLSRYTDSTITSLAALKRTLKEDLERGYVITHSTYEEGVFAVAAPVRDVNGEVIAAINASGSETLVSKEELDGRIRDNVVETALTISKNMGYLPRVAKGI